MKNNKKKGISLIVLVITIIVIIILAGSIILLLSTNNPIGQASKATYLSDVRNFQTELELYKANQFTDKMGIYIPVFLQADETIVTYNDVVDPGKTMFDLIPSLRGKAKYAGQFGVVDGELVFGGLDTKQQEWATEAGINIVVIGEPKVAIVPPANTAVAPGTNIVYTIKFSSNVALETIDLTGKVEVLDNNGVALPSQPEITVGTVSGTSLDNTRQVDITISTGSLSFGAYKLKIKAEAVTNVNDISNSQDKISLIGFDITDNIPPTNPTMLADTTAWTNGDVTVTITYSGDTLVKEYSTDGTNWNNYTSPIVVTENNTTVYAKGKDSAGNESGQTTLTVTNIDKNIPTVAYGTNGENNAIQVSTTVTVTDVGGSGLNLSSLQYKWDTQNITSPSSGWVTFTNGAVLTKNTKGTYYLWIKANDNVGNILLDKTNAFIVGDLPVSTVQADHKTFSGATTGFSHDNPVIPAGFVAVDTDDAKWTNLGADWNKGLVIQDSSGYQFVWVPVDGINVPFAKWCVTGIPYNDANISDDTLPAGFSISNITTTYKGFYIARYEDMRSNYGTVKTYCENLALNHGYDTAKLGTNLITGTEWDTTMKWIQNSGKSVTNSRSWGNYSDSMAPANVLGFGTLKVSGYSNYWKANNIYDLAGNLREWTSEKYISDRVPRGGIYNLSGSSGPAADRAASGMANSWSCRPALYIK